MNMWDILGIQPTTDIKDIKKAYARKAREYHPEEHPQEFQELQWAYKLALKYGKEHGEAGELQYHSQPEQKQVIPVQPEPESKQKRTTPVQPELESKQKRTTPVQPEPESKQKRTTPVQPEPEPKQKRTTPVQPKPEQKQTASVQTEQKQAEQHMQVSPGQGQKPKSPQAESSREEPLYVEDVLGQSFTYDYSSIKTRKENRELRFWSEFYALYWHPYLRNNLISWYYFLNLPRYQPLFKDDDFREGLVNQICRDGAVWWNRDTIRLFDEHLKKFQSQKMKLYETTSHGWRRQMQRLNNKCLFTAPGHSREEKRFYQKIWNPEIEKGIMRRDGQKLEKYLKMYFEYSLQNKEEQQQIYGRANYLRKLKVGVFWVFMALFTAGLLIIPDFYGGSGRGNTPVIPYEIDPSDMERIYEMNPGLRDNSQTQTSDTEEMLQDEEQMKDYLYQKIFETDPGLRGNSQTQTSDTEERLQNNE